MSLNEIKTRHGRDRWKDGLFICAALLLTALSIGSAAFLDQIFEGGVSEQNRRDALAKGLQSAHDALSSTGLSTDAARVVNSYKAQANRTLTALANAGASEIDRLQFEVHRLELRRVLLFRVFNDFCILARAILDRYFKVSVGE